MSKDTILGLEIVAVIASFALGVRFYLNWKEGRTVFS